jgi:hypothetical protein
MLETVHIALKNVIVIVAVVLLVWRSIRYIVRSTDFIVELKTNHLPHIYERLNSIEEALHLKRHSFIAGKKE